MGFRLAPSNLTLDDPGGKGQRQNPVTRNISKTAIDTRLDPREHLYAGPTGFRLAPSDLTLNGQEGSKIKVILFDVKCQERQLSLIHI